MLGTFVLSTGYYEAYYRKAQQIRSLIRNDFLKAFETCDVIMGPASPTTAFLLGEKVDDPMKMYLSDVYTVSGPLAGLPSISIPMGKDSQGLPMGIQLTAGPFKEEILFPMAHWVENHMNPSS